jgi:spore maturation protein CgeB
MIVSDSLKNVFESVLIYESIIVGISVPKRLEYLQAIAELAERKNYSLWISGHFWHTNNFLNYLVGKIKFKWKYPLLAKYIKNIFVQPQELAVIYSKSKICLNINVSYHKSFNTRNFDIMYSNRLLISDAEDLTGIDIVPNRDFIMCKDIADMVSKIDYYLQHEELADEIRKNGKKIVEQKYLFIQTLDKVLS